MQPNGQLDYHSWTMLRAGLHERAALHSGARLNIAVWLINLTKVNNVIFLNYIEYSAHLA